MFSGDDTIFEYAKDNVLLNADLWISEDETHFRRTNLDEWLRWTIVQSLTRSKLLDCFAVLWSKLSKRVQHIIPFNLVDELRFYEFDVSVSSLDLSTSGYENIETQCHKGGKKVEPWLLPEVERIFKLVSSARSSRYDAAGYRLAERGYFAHGTCDKFCPFFQVKLVLFRLFGTSGKGGKGAAEDALPDLELDVVTKEENHSLHGPLKCPCNPQDVLSQEFLRHHHRLLTRVRLSDVFYDDYEQETRTYREGFHRLPKYEENISVSRPYIQYVDRYEYSLYLKVSSETIKNIWKRAIPKVEGKNFSGNFKQTRTVPNTKESQLPQPGARQVGACHLVNSSGVSYVPPKPPGLNVEVPEFYPRQDDMTLGQDVSQIYFPSGSFANFPKSLFPYMGATGEDRKISVNPNSSLNVNSVSSPGKSSATQKSNPPHYGMQSDFRGHTLQQYQPTNYQNQAHLVLQQQQTLQSHQPQPHNLLSNNVIPMMQKSLTPMFSGAEQHTVSGRQTLTAGTSLEHQAWIANVLRLYYQQQFYQALSQVDLSVHSSPTASGLQYSTPEVANQFSHRKNYEQKLTGTDPPNCDISNNDGLLSDKLKVEEKEELNMSPPKNIPVYQRPPESYNFTQNDNNGRRRNGAGGGGGGAVLANLIVLTKGGGRWKSSRHQVPDHGPKEKLVKDSHYTKVEKSETPACGTSDDKTVKSNAASCLPDKSEGVSLVSSHDTSIIETSRNEDVSEEISTIVFESSSTSSAVNIEIPSNTSTASLEATDLIEAYCPGAGAGHSKESEGSIQAYLPDYRKGICKTVTSTPIKEGNQEAENADSFRWPDLTFNDEDVLLDEGRADKKKEIGVAAVENTSVDPSPKFAQASKSLENSVIQSSNVKETISDPSFPPIRSKKSRTSRLKSAESVSAPAFNCSGHRRLYSDVLSTRAGIVPSNYKIPPASEASSSVDSLEKRFRELEIQAMEQYQSQSSLDSVARIYHDLEMQAVEQYRSSCESESKIVAERSLTSVKEDSEELVKEPISSNSRRLNDLKEQPTSSLADQKEGLPVNEPATIAPPQAPVVILHEVKNNEHFNAAISSTSIDVVSTGAEIGKTLSVDGDNAGAQPIVKSETELLVRQEKPVEEVSSQVSCPNISSHRLRNKRSKSALKANRSRNQGKFNHPDRGSTSKRQTNGNCCGIPSSGEVPSKSSANQLTRISQPVNQEASTDRLCSALHEAPNEQRTQASTTTGTKSEEKKESPTQEKDTGVPEAWVLNRVHDETSDLCVKNADKGLSRSVKNKNHARKGAEIVNNKSERTANKSNLGQGTGDTQASQTITLPENNMKNLEKSASRSNLSGKQSGRSKKKDIKAQGFGTEACIVGAKAKENFKSSLAGRGAAENKSDHSKKKDVSGQKLEEAESFLPPMISKEKLQVGVVDNVSAEQKSERTKVKTALGKVGVKSCEDLKISAVESVPAKEKSANFKGKGSLDQEIGAAIAHVLHTKSKENLESPDVEKCFVEKTGFVGDDIKRGPNKKRRRGNRRKNKTNPQEIRIDVQATKTTEDHCKVMPDSVKGDILSEDLVEVKACDDDSTKFWKEHLYAKPYVASQPIHISCASHSFHDISSEKNGIADDAGEDAVSKPMKCFSECGIFPIQDKGVSGRKKRRNKKPKASKSSEDVVPLNISLEPSHEENPTLACINNFNDDKKPVIPYHDRPCQENFHLLSESISVSSREHCDEVTKILPSENSIAECCPNTQLSRQDSSIDFEFSVSPPETVDELHCSQDELLGLEDISLNLGCSASVGEMAALISRRIKRGKKSKSQKKRLIQDNLGCEIFEDANPVHNDGAIRRGSESVCLNPVGIGCCRSTIREEDIDTQLLIPSLCEDPGPERSCKYEFANINVVGNAFRSVEMQSDEVNADSHLGYQKRIVTATDFGENSGSSFVSMGSHFGTSAHPSIVDTAPTSSNQGMVSQYSALSLSRNSSESTPRTPQSTESNKSTSSSPSVLSKLMRSSKKTRKAKAAGSSGVCGRSPPSCTVQ